MTTDLLTLVLLILLMLIDDSPRLRSPHASYGNGTDRHLLKPHGLARKFDHALCDNHWRPPQGKIAFGSHAFRRSRSGRCSDRLFAV